MLITELIIAICWLTFIVYWAINWRRVKPTLETRWSAKRFRLYAIVFALIAALLYHVIIIPVFHPPRCVNQPGTCNQLFFPPTQDPPILLIISSLSAITGIAIAITARRTLAGNWSANIDFKQNHQLITTGIYHYIRHPIYTGMLLLLTATLLLIHNLSQIVIFIVVLGFVLYKARTEEKLMLKHFPKQYPTYRHHTKAFIPFLF